MELRCTAERETRLLSILRRELQLSSTLVRRLKYCGAYTVNGTWLTREESLKGTLAPGKLADLIVIDRDYFTVPDEAIKEIQVLMTMVGGQFVYSAT